VSQNSRRSREFHPKPCIIGDPKPNNQEFLRTEDWSAEARLAVVIETAILSETELARYCREKGLLPEQVKHSNENRVLPRFILLQYLS